MSLHDAIDIQQREADLKKASSPLLAAAGFLIIIGLIVMVITATGSGGRRESPDAYPLILISAGGIYLTYQHFKNRRRIEKLELEILKLKRRLSES
jgi:threonine/homoserine/homoserine lactone efflux protein